MKQLEVHDRFTQGDAVYIVQHVHPKVAPDRVMLRVRRPTGSTDYIAFQYDNGEVSGITKSPVQFGGRKR